jgi:hypothetical protein
LIQRNAWPKPLPHRVPTPESPVPIRVWSINASSFGRADSRIGPAGRTWFPHRPDTRIRELKRNTEPVALSSAASTDRPSWALRPSASDLWKRHRLTRAPCSVRAAIYVISGGAQGFETPKSRNEHEVPQKGRSVRRTSHDGSRDGEHAPRAAGTRGSRSLAAFSEAPCGHRSPRGAGGAPAPDRVAGHA